MWSGDSISRLLPNRIAEALLMDTVRTPPSKPRHRSACSSACRPFTLDAYIWSDRWSSSARPSHRALDVTLSTASLGMSGVQRTNPSKQTPSPAVATHSTVTLDELRLVLKSQPVGNGRRRYRTGQRGTVRILSEPEHTAVRDKTGRRPRLGRIHTHVSPL